MAQQHGGHGAHGHHGSGNAKAGPQTPAAKAFTEANAKMHRDMAIAFSGNSDVDFARGMIPHHQGAIDMAEIVLRYGKDATVKKLAAEVIAAQRKEIAQMRTWLSRRAAAVPAAGADADAIKRAYEDVNTAMHKAMDLPLTDNADKDFMQGMIPHHEGAVDMAKVQLRYGTDAELRRLAESIIASQTEEIALMKGWLAGGGKPPVHKH
jgi:uncharacterized protein (DUF305 family)